MQCLKIGLRRGTDVDRQLNLRRKDTDGPVGAALKWNSPRSGPRGGDDDGASDDCVSSAERMYAASSYGLGHCSSVAFAVSRAALGCGKHIRWRVAICWPPLI